MPFFGLIAFGFGATRLMRLPAQGVSGLNLFVYYFAMPAWFFQLVATTPFREIEHWSFLAATTFATYCAFAIAFSFCVTATVMVPNAATAAVNRETAATSNLPRAARTCPRT